MTKNKCFNWLTKIKIANLLRQKWWAVVMLMLLIICELTVISKAYLQPNNMLSQTPWFVVLPLVGIFLILVIIGVYRKVYAFDKLIIKDFLANSLAGGYITIFFLIAFLITVAFVPTLIRDFVAGEHLAWWGMLAGIAAIPLEVLIYPASYSSTKCPMEEREVLVSAISFRKPQTKNGETASFELSKYQNDGFYYPIDSCKNINEIWVVVSPEFINNAHACFPGISKDEEVVKHYVQEIISKKSTKIDINISKPVDYNDFDKCYEVVKEVFNKIGEEKAKKTIVNISPGTAMIGSALAMFAIQGNRILAYNRQDDKGGNPFTQSSANVLSMKELIEEMIIEIQNSRQAKE